MLETVELLCVDLFIFDLFCFLRLRLKTVVFTVTQIIFGIKGPKRLFEKRPHMLFGLLVHNFLNNNIFVLILLILVVFFIVLEHFGPDLPVLIKQEHAF